MTQALVLVTKPGLRRCRQLSTQRGVITYPCSWQKSSTYGMFQLERPCKMLTPPKAVSWDTRAGVYRSQVNRVIAVDAVQLTVC